MFSKLTDPRGSRKEPIIRTGCGFWHDRNDIRGVFDLARLDQILSKFSPFQIEGWEERFAEFSEVLYFAKKQRDGLMLSVCGNDGGDDVDICEVDLT